jgi:hypothetical protein
VHVLHGLSPAGARHTQRAPSESAPHLMKAFRRGR